LFLFTLRERHTDSEHIEPVNPINPLGEKFSPDENPQAGEGLHRPNSGNLSRVSAWVWGKSRKGLFKTNMRLNMGQSDWPIASQKSD
jgi:hypothetical protein